MFTLTGLADASSHAWVFTTCSRCEEDKRGRAYDDKKDDKMTNKRARAYDDKRDREMTSEMVM
eukprot:6406120-Amphidinium_carterae.1